MSADNKELKNFVKNHLIKSAEKLKEKFSPFSEVVKNVSKTMKVKKIYKLKEKTKKCYLIIVNNYSKHPKLRYFIAKILASQSSDLLVHISKDFAKKHDLNLVQYPLNPSILRVNLLGIKELNEVDNFSSVIDLLNKFYLEVQRNLTRIRSLMENE